jgi:hypothetical protein
VRLAGVHKLLCNTCGHVFQGFDPLRKLGRKPAKRDSNLLNRRRSPRFHAHLPTAISLIERTAKDGIARYSEPSKGHCEAINEYGMGLSLVGSKFAEHEITGKGTLLFVRIHLPESTIEAVVSVLNHERVGEDKKRKWLLGVKIQQISDTDKENLLAYLKKRKLEQPLIESE